MVKSESQSVSDSGCSKPEPQPQQQKEEADAGKRRSSEVEAEKTLKSKKRVRSSDECGLEQTGTPSESLPAVVTMDANVGAPSASTPSPPQQDRPAQWWLNLTGESNKFSPLPPPPPLVENRQVLIRPTSVPLFRPETGTACSADGTTLPAGFVGPSLDVSMFSSRAGFDQAGGDIGGRKSFVEWKPMVSAGPSQLPPWNHLSLQAPWMAPNLNFPASGEERQFLGPTDRERPLRTSLQAQVSIPVVMEGRSVGGSICLQQYEGYPSFAGALRSMFSQNSSSSESSQCSLSEAFPGYLVAYEDEDGDLLLAGDLSWRSFVRRAKRIRILAAKGRSIGVP